MVVWANEHGISEIMLDLQTQARLIKIQEVQVTRTLLLQQTKVHKSGEVSNVQSHVFWRVI